MKSEKVKEIKKALELNEYYAIQYFPKPGEIKIFKFSEILTLIDKLESENERHKEKQSKAEEIMKSGELSKITKQDMYYYYLTNCGYLENEIKRFKDRIAELEKENAKLNRDLDERDWVDYPCRLIEKEDLKQFAERLKEKAEYDYLADYNTNDEPFIEKTDFLRIVDETLKEFVK